MKNTHSRIRLASLLLLIVAAVFSLAGRAQAQDIKKARQLADNKKYDESISEYLLLAAKDSTNVTILEELAGTCEKAGRYEDSIDAYKRLLAVDPARLDIYRKTGDILYEKLGRGMEALWYYRAVLKNAPESPEAKEIAEMLKKKEEVVLVDTLMPRTILASRNEFRDSYDSYEPAAKSVMFLKSVKIPVKIEVFMATWCPDSWAHVPKLIKLLKQVSNPAIGVEYIGVDREKKTPSGREKGKGIQRIPTFIVYRGDKEIGRIIETPAVSLEEDLAGIIEN